MFSSFIFRSVLGLVLLVAFVPVFVHAALVKSLPYLHQFQNPIEIHTSEDSDLKFSPLSKLKPIQSLEDILADLPDEGGIDGLGCFELRDRAESFSEDWQGFSSSTPSSELKTALSDHIADVEEGLEEYNCGRFRSFVVKTYFDLKVLQTKKICSPPKPGVTELFCLKKKDFQKSVGDELQKFIQAQENHIKHDYLMDILESHKVLMERAQKAVKGFFVNAEKGLWQWYVHLKQYETERVAIPENAFKAFQVFGDELSNGQQVIYGMSDILRTYLEELEALVGDRASELDVEVPEELVEKLLKFNDENSGMRYFEQVFGNDLSQHRRRILIWHEHLKVLHLQTAQIPLGAFNDMFLEYKDMSTSLARYKRMVSGPKANLWYGEIHQEWTSFINSLKPTVAPAKP